MELSFQVTHRIGLWNQIFNESLYCWISAVAFSLVTNRQPCDKICFQEKNLSYSFSPIYHYSLLNILCLTTARSPSNFPTAEGTGETNRQGKTRKTVSRSHTSLPTLSSQIPYKSRGWMMTMKTALSSIVKMMRMKVRMIRIL